MPHISHGFVSDRASGSSIGGNHQWSEWLSRDRDNNEGYDDLNDEDDYQNAGHNQTIHVQCLAQFQPTTNKTTVTIPSLLKHAEFLNHLHNHNHHNYHDQVCNNGTWSSVPKCIPAKCTELPDAPRNGMVLPIFWSSSVLYVYLYLYLINAAR